ncbi:hypothetical protein [Schaalia sp. lx-100]|uniref:hypothetical protein n=1 Tax=Schaalia sp. lx-100 TaxID=2899081 RepID=UPI001E4FF2AD|nr:hypothetical protein [Schaalia sp. lx-100]MCD4557657.1 hypothetical protein [Schaalia sp. lx-100]
MMALFEFDEGRLIPAQFGRNVPGGVTPEVVRAVCSQVLEIVSRPLFPITWDDAVSHGDESKPPPRLIALDATGQVVSVEVVQHLDSDVLISSLSRLAHTAALSWSDLAQEYPGDIEGFKSGWARFKESMPPSAGSGPRLVMVVASIDESVRPALDVLATSGVEVHEMSFRQMTNGRTFLEVATVGSRIYGHAPYVLSGRSTQVPSISASERAPEVPTPAKPEHVSPQVSSVDPHIRISQPDAPRRPDSFVLSAQTQAQVPPRSRRYGREVLSDLRSHQDEGLQAARLADAASYSSVDRQDFSDRAAQGNADSALAVDVSLLKCDKEGLRALARIIGEDVLLKSHPDTGIPSGFVLGTDGMLHFGPSVFRTPDEAMIALGLPSVNGWEHLHIADRRGPSLKDSVEEVNRERIRERRRRPARSREYPARH